MKIIIRKYESPCGALLLGSFDGKLCICDWMTCAKNAGTAEGSSAGTMPGTTAELIAQTRSGSMVMRRIEAGAEVGTTAAIEAAATQLDEYFGGKRRDFDVPVLLLGTDFRTKVWKELTAISFGRTTTYSEVARRLGSPKAVRAVANAIGANPLSIIIPCHRVIGADGALTGYAGGLTAKSKLLQIEGHRVMDGSRISGGRLSFKKLQITDKDGITAMSSVATAIVREHYDPIVGKEQNDYMLDKFQSVHAIRHQLTEGYQYYFVYNSEGQAIGFLAFYPKEHCMYLSKFYLQKSERGKGYSRKMLGFLVKKATLAGFSAIELNVNRCNSSILAYRKLGFRMIREEKIDIGSGYFMDDFVLRLDF